MSLKKGALYLFAGSAGQAMLRVLFTAVLARLLTPADFGLIATATIITGFADIFVQFGFGQGLVQKSNVTQKDVETAYLSSGILGIAFGIITILSAPAIATFFEQPQLTSVLYIFSILFPLKSLNQVQFSLLQREMRFKALAGRDGLSYVVGYGIVGIYLAYIGYGVYALVIATIVQAITYSFLLGMNHKKYKFGFSFNKDSYTTLFEFGKNLTLSKVFNYMAMKGDYFIVSKFLGATSLGFYSRAYGLMNMPTNLMGNVINTILFSDFSKNQNEKEKTLKRLEQSYQIILQLTIPLLPWFYFFAEDIVMVLLGEKWISVVPVFRILVFAMAFRLLYKVSVSMLKGGGYIKYQRNCQFIYMLLVIGGSYIGSYFNISAVAWFVNIAIIVNFFLLTHYVVLKTEYCWRHFLTTFFYTLPLFLIVGVMSYTINLFNNNFKNFGPFLNVIISLCLILFVLILSDFFISKFAYDGRIKKILKSVFINKKHI